MKMRDEEKTTIDLGQQQIYLLKISLKIYNNLYKKKQKKILKDIMEDRSLSNTFINLLFKK